VSDISKRPLTFAFNGGPGSSSVWLHLGTLGPKRVAMQTSGQPLPPPYKLVDNEFSILDVTDLVFIGPVTTAIAAPLPVRTRASSMDFRATSIPSASSFASILHGTRAGPRPSSWRAKVTPPRARPRCPVSCRRVV
jgi:hypothetical protein